MMLECHHLGFDYKDKSILTDISFEVPKGHFCVLLGRNGSGKTTLLHCLNRILRPVTGRVCINGMDLSELSPNDIARAISLVPQEHIDIFPFRVLDVVVMGRAPFLKMSARPDENDYRTAVLSLKALNADHLSHKNFNRISGGERQIVLLARSLAQASPVMLLDEPTNHLDFNHQYHLLASVKRLCREKNICIVASMHDPNMAVLFADSVIMLKDGRIMAKGSKDRVMTRTHISALYAIDTHEVLIAPASDPGKKIFLPCLVIKDRSDI